jgi:aminoglycoside phosphotransferase
MSVRGSILPAPEQKAADDRSEIELKGFSGARIVLIREDEAPPFVRKISGSVSGNARLKTQAIKQKLTGSLLDAIAATPRILDEGDLDGLYYFDMDYVKGLDGISFLRTAEFDDVRAFADGLCASLGRFAALEDDRQALVPRDVMLTKCREILASLPVDEMRGREIMERLVALVSAANLPEELTQTACHGDLTLENIVVTEDGRIYFIDLLDTFFPHWLADVAKLDQDLEGGWYTRKSPALPPGIIHYLRDRLIGFSEAQLPGAQPIIALILCVHFARILPYTRTEADRQFVLDRLDVLIARACDEFQSTTGSVR